MPRYRRLLIFVTSAVLFCLGIGLIFSLFGLRAETFIGDAVLLGPEPQKITTESRPVAPVPAPQKPTAADLTGPNKIDSTDSAVMLAAMMVDEPESSSTAVDQTESRSVPPVSDAVLADIEDIRKQVGITALPLTENSDADAGDFRAALHAAAADEQVDESDGEKDERPAAIHSMATDSTDSVDDPRQRLSDVDEAFINYLQGAIELLEQRADRAEMHQRYDTADRMRRTVQRLRREIRALKPIK